MSTGGRKNDWARSIGAYLVAWGFPSIILLAGLLVPTGQRAVIWTAALVWMGTGCLLNARRCGRTHCRYTGPYYLLMIIPVWLLASGTVSAATWAWWLVAAMILLGSKAISWFTEQRWGTYRR